MTSINGVGFYCGICKKDERFERSWNHHVSSIGHQRQLSRQPLGGQGTWETAGNDVKERVVEVVGCRLLEASPYDIVEYLTKCGGVLEEFICPTSLAGVKPEIIYCLFKDAESVGRILEVDDPKIFRESVVIQRKFSCWDDTNYGNIKITVNGGHSGIDNLSTKNGQNGNTGAEKPSRMKTKSINREGGGSGSMGEQLAELLDLHDSEIRGRIVNDLRKLVTETFSNSIVTSYGSDFLGISLASDTIRLCVDPYGKFQPNVIGVIVRNPADEMAVGFIYQILTTHKQPDGSPMFKFVSQYSVSRCSNVPEISFNYTMNEQLVPCTLQFENFISVQKARVLKFLIGMDVRVLIIFSLIRHWSKKHKILHEIREGEEFDGYILLMLMVFHLIRTSVIPSVAFLRELGRNKLLIVDNLDVCFCSDKTELPPTKEPQLKDNTVRQLSAISILLGFFKFFANFDFSTTVVCSSTGRVLERSKFNQQLENLMLPELVNQYSFDIDGNLKVQKKLNVFSPAVIQDVFDLTDNVAMAVDEEHLALFKSKCARTYKFLKRLMEKGSGDIEIFFNETISINEDDDEEDLPSEPPPLPPPPPPPSMEDILFPKML